MNTRQVVTMVVLAALLAVPLAYTQFTEVLQAADLLQDTFGTADMNLATIER